MPKELQLAIFNRMNAPTSVRAQIAIPTLKRVAKTRAAGRNSNNTPVANAIHQLTVARNHGVAREANARVRRLANSGSATSGRDVNDYVRGAHAKLDLVQFRNTLEKLVAAAKSPPTNAGTYTDMTNNYKHQYFYLRQTRANTPSLNTLKELHSVGVPLGGQALVHEIMVYGKSHGGKSGPQRLAYRLKHGLVDERTANNALEHAYENPVTMTLMPRVFLRELHKRASSMQLARCFKEIDAYYKKLLRNGENENANAASSTAYNLMLPVIEELESRPPSWGKGFGLAQGMSLACMRAKNDDSVIRIIRRFMQAGANPFVDIDGDKFHGQCALEIWTVVLMTRFKTVQGVHAIPQAFKSIFDSFLEVNDGPGSNGKKRAVTRALISIATRMKLSDRAYLETQLLRHRPDLSSVYDAVLQKIRTKEKKTLNNLKWLVEHAGYTGLKAPMVMKIRKILES